MEVGPSSKSGFSTFPFSAHFWMHVSTLPTSSFQNETRNSRNLFHSNAGSASLWYLQPGKIFVSFDILQIKCNPKSKMCIMIKCCTFMEILAFLQFRNDWTWSLFEDNILKHGHSSIKRSFRRWASTVLQKATIKGLQLSIFGIIIIIIIRQR